MFARSKTRCPNPIDLDGASPSLWLSTIPDLCHAISWLEATGHSHTRAGQLVLKYHEACQCDRIHVSGVQLNGKTSKRGMKILWVYVSSILAYLRWIVSSHHIDNELVWNLLINSASSQVMNIIEFQLGLATSSHPSTLSASFTAHQTDFSLDSIRLASIVQLEVAFIVVSTRW